MNKEWRLAALAGLCYCAGAIGLRMFFGGWLGILAQGAIHARQFAWAALVQQVPTLLASVPVGFVLFRSRALRRIAFGRFSGVRSLVVSSMAYFLLFIYLDGVGAWPFFWRWREFEALTYMAAVIDARKWDGLLINAVSSLLLIPLVEEVVFRGGVLRWVRRVTGSASFAVVASAIAFGAAHWGNTPGAKINALWLTGLSIVLGRQALRHPRTLAPCAATHATRNAADLFGLVVVTLRTR